MSSPQVVSSTEDMDGLRLLALGRISRCERCPRYAAIVAAYRSGRNGSRVRPRPLPEVPRDCRAAYCATLAIRYGNTPSF